MKKDIFTKHWDRDHGFTLAEAEIKKAKVDEAHGVFSHNAKWHPAQIEIDPNKADGYMVTIEPAV